MFRVATCVVLLGIWGSPVAAEPPPQNNGLEGLSKPSLLGSPAEERARLEHARAAELTRTLELLPGVVNARVHVSLPLENSLTLAPLGRPTASVLVRTEPHRTVKEDEVRLLVTHAVGDLLPQDVAVLIAPIDAIPAPTVCLQESNALWRIALCFALTLIAALAVVVVILARRLIALRQK